MFILSSFFDRIGLADMEKVHSAVIGWLFSDYCQALDNIQKSELLCSLFSVTPIKVFQTIKVELEQHNMDIIILTDEDTPNAACWIIENKIKSSQHSDQLDKYVSIVNGEEETIGRSKLSVKDYESFKKHFCLLTLVDEKARCKNAIWNNVTYKKFSQLLCAMNLDTNPDGVILGEYRQCITNLSNVLDDFLGNHQAYDNVFTDGSKKKGCKSKIRTSGKYSDFIAKNGLETIFQKCFLAHINQLSQKWKYDWSISETHGIALLEYRIKKEDKMSYGVQIQNGSFKVQVLGISNNNEQLKDEFWKNWNLNNLSLPDGWKLNYSKGKKVPYFSISKKINLWYCKTINEIVKEWDSMHDDCMKIVCQLSEHFHRQV